jgi:hypothetical protein
MTPTKALEDTQVIPRHQPELRVVIVHFVRFELMALPYWVMFRVAIW